MPNQRPKSTTAMALNSCQAAVIWQPYTVDSGPGEPTLLVHSDDCGLLVITPDGREVLIQRETLPELIKLLKRLDAERPDE